MSSEVSTYLKNIQNELATGVATEHSYRPALKDLLESLKKGIRATNEPKREEWGAPDYIVLKGKAPVGYVEAKDIGKNLDQIEKSDQLKRYRKGLNNLILTDYLEFRWYEGGELRLSARLARLDKKKKLVPDKSGQADFEKLVAEFFASNVPTVSSPKELAARMAALAGIIRGLIDNAFQDERQTGVLHSQLDSFRETLLHDLKPDQFADMYAQTVCYGLFAARCHHNGKGSFTRERAAHELPKTNPFLRKLFGQMAGPEMEESIEWAVDDLVELLNRVDIDAILKDFGRRTKRQDPVVHFYETFLTAYNPKLRDQRGVYYTPEPVVSFIVRSVDHILKTDFGLKAGLADKSKVPLYELVTDKKDNTKKVKKGECHKVLILDPAVGTGTFLHNVIDHIYEGFRGNKGMWSGYVSEHLLPRLFGFELLMAPYTVSHMKLGLQLQETGYDFKSDERLNVILTNSLEESVLVTPSLPFGQFIAEEANEAGKVKQDLPVMVILGNPPYSGHSQTPSEIVIEIKVGQKYQTTSKGAIITKTAKRPMKRKMKTFIGNLIQNYFQVDGKPLGERNPKWLNDDYVKFIRFSQWRIEQTGYGVLAFITNHGYLNNPTFRGMRQSLMKTFDDIYILDLHGNSGKKERCPDGSKDENVFDIQQGVAIGIFVKKDRKSEGLAKVHHADLWGKRSGKYEWLSSNSTSTTECQLATASTPHFSFRTSDERLQREYDAGFAVTTLFNKESVGIVTARDRLCIDYDAGILLKRIKDFANLDPEVARQKYELGPDAKDWTVESAQQDVRTKRHISKHIIPISYRPFDSRSVFYTGNSRGFICRPRHNLMRHMLVGENLAVISARSNKSQSMDHFFCCRSVSEAKAAERTTQSCLFPLYLYPDQDKGDLFDNGDVSDSPGGRKPNLDPEFVKQMAAKLKMKFVSDGKGDLKKSFGPEDIFNYMYAVFHSPTYRTRYAEFLKIDFPRLPLTSRPALFRKLCALGGQLVGLHLVDDTFDANVNYPIAGDDIVDKVRYSEQTTDEKSKVWINKTQYFENIPQIVWEFHIGGYQVLQKWLKDRKGRKLDYDDQSHYLNIVGALSETIRLMSEIDQTIEKHGGWPIE